MLNELIAGLQLINPRGTLEQSRTLNPPHVATGLGLETGASEAGMGEVRGTTFTAESIREGLQRVSGIGAKSSPAKRPDTYAAPVGQHRMVRDAARGRAPPKQQGVEALSEGAGGDTAQSVGTAPAESLPTDLATMGERKRASVSGQKGVGMNVGPSPASSHLLLGALPRDVRKSHMSESIGVSTSTSPVLDTPESSPAAIHRHADSLERTTVHGGERRCWRR